MKTIRNPTDSVISEFTYEGCKYSGITANTSFSVLSDNMAQYLTDTFPFLEEVEVAPVAENSTCCAKCGKDCKSKYMKDRHQNVCKEEMKGLVPLLKPTFVFWKYKGLDKTQLTNEQLLEGLGEPAAEKEDIISESEISEPMPGTPGTAMIGKNMQKVVTDRDGIDWYGDGLEDDIA